MQSHIELFGDFFFSLQLKSDERNIVAIFCINDWLSRPFHWTLSFSNGEWQLSVFRYQSSFFDDQSNVAMINILYVILLSPSMLRFEFISDYDNGKKTRDYLCDSVHCDSIGYRIWYDSNKNKLFFPVFKIRLIEKYSQLH